MANFKLPESFLNQLNEFTDGFFLITINDSGDFEVHQSLDSSVKNLAMAKFIEMWCQEHAADEFDHEEDDFYEEGEEGCET